MGLLERSDRFDAAIVDVHMPEKDGYEVCELAKSLHANLPVLLLVGVFEPFDEDRYRQCGADEVLKKPFDSQDLLRIMERLLARPPHRESRVMDTPRKR